MSSSKRAPTGTSSSSKPTSRSSTGSDESIGLGSGSGSGSGSGGDRDRDYDFVKLRPTGGTLIASSSAATYDCVVYFIYCVEHAKVALTEVDPGVYWLPFVARDNLPWSKAAAEGLDTLVQRRDADGTVVSTLDLAQAECTRYHLQFARLQAINLTWTVRLIHLVRMGKCGLGCEPVNSLQWMSMTELSHKSDGPTHFWGPEVVAMYDKYRSNKTLSKMSLVVEHKIDSILQHICDATSTDPMAQLFQSASLSTEQLCDLHENYLQHTYPSLGLNLASFRIYLCKLGFVASKAFGSSASFKDSDEAALVKAIYGACLRRPKRATKDQPYLDFLDVSYALVAMDPTTPVECPRARFLFCLYDLDQDGTLNGPELARLLVDNPTAPKDKLKAALQFKDFEAAIQRKQLPALDKLCRLPKSLVAVLQQSSDIKSAESQIEPTSSKESGKIKSVRVRGVCPKCRVKHLDYGQHCVSIDSMGRCVDAQVIVQRNPNQSQPGTSSSSSNPHQRTQQQYSLEHVFSLNSLGNMFLDYIRSRKFALDSDHAADQHRQRNTYEQIRDLCEHVASLVRAESRMVVKRQSPAVIVGDLAGSLESLLAMELQLWRALPVLGDSLVFLGNYTGHAPGSAAIEVLIYLLAIKYISPDKVVLLRGLQETREHNTKTLLLDCKTRFGEELGAEVWEAFNSVFDTLPHVALINEAIVCVSSGIPDTATKDTRLAALTEEPATLRQFLVNTPDLATDVAPTDRSKPREVTFKPLPAPAPTGAHSFSAGALAKFLCLNLFSHLVRTTNEYLSEGGYALCFGRRCITLESHNCGASPLQSHSSARPTTQASVALVSHPRGRISLCHLQGPAARR